MEQDTATSVYRYYDEYDVLIYVGITSRGAKRNAEHYKSKAWWPMVVRQEVEHYSTRDEAAAREVTLIRQHQPPYNTQHNEDSRRARLTYEAVRTKLPAEPIDPLSMARDLGKALPLTDVTSAENGCQFITDAAHVPLAGKLVLNGVVRVLDGSLVVGRVMGIERHGPFTVLTANVRAGIARDSAVADVRVEMAKGGPIFQLRRIRL